MSCVQEIKCNCCPFSASTSASPCSPVIDVGTSSTIWTTTTASTTSYACHTFSWTASNTATFTFQMILRNDPDVWCIDDVSILDGATEKLVNGGFETGSFSPWIRTFPYGKDSHSTPAALTNLAGVARTGTYGLRDGSYKYADQVAQSFSAVSGQTYVISFWLKSTVVTSPGMFAGFYIV